MSALMLACATNRYNVVKLLIDSGAEVNKKDEKGLTALERAKKDDNERVIEELEKNV